MGVTVFYDILKEGTTETRKIYCGGTEKEIESFKQNVREKGIDFLQDCNKYKIIKIGKIVDD